MEEAQGVPPVLAAAPLQAAAHAAQPPAPLPPARKSGGVRCQVPGCSVDLSQARLFHQRYHVCPDHCTADSVLMGGAVQRFCQQCGQFHDVERFAPSMRSCRAQLARHAERRRLRRAQAKAAAEAKRGLELAQLQAATAGAGVPAAQAGEGAPAVAAAPGPPADTQPASPAPSGAPALLTSNAAGAGAGAALLGSRAPKRKRSPVALQAGPAIGPACTLPPPDPLQLHLHLQPKPPCSGEGGDAEQAQAQQQAGSTASEQSARSTHPHLPAQPSMDVLLVAAAAGAQAQAVMAGGAAAAAAPRSQAQPPWALLPGPGQWAPTLWPPPAPWTWAAGQQWPPQQAAPFWGAPPPPLPPAAPADLLQLLLRQAAPAGTELQGQGQGQGQAAGPAGEQLDLDLLVGAFRAAGEQHLRQWQGDAAVAALLARMAQQTPEQNAAQLQQLLSTLTQPL